MEGSPDSPSESASIRMKSKNRDLSPGRLGEENDEFSPAGFSELDPADFSLAIREARVSVTGFF